MKADFSIDDLVRIRVASRLTHLMLEELQKSAYLSSNLKRRFSKNVNPRCRIRTSLVTGMARAVPRHLLQSRFDPR